MGWDSITHRAFIAVSMHERLSNRLLKFAEETVTESLIEEIKPLIQRHYEELGRFKDIQLDPNFAEYLAAKDFISVFTVRDDTVLVGYTIFFVTPSLHHRHVKQALQDILWLSPGHRKRGLGADFLSWVDERLREKGVQVVMQVVRNRAVHGTLVEAMGYEPLEWVYVRRFE